MSDVQYYQDHGFSREEAKRQVVADKASTSLIISIFTLFFKLITFFFLFLPGVFCAYLILQFLRVYPGRLTALTYFLWIAGIVYILECLLFLLKGWAMSLKERGSWPWTILWTICFLYCFVLPALVLQVFIYGQFGHTQQQVSSVPIIASWLGAAILGWLIYRRYSLGSDAAPKWMFWIYRLGRRIPG
jgi:hypothetical protein